MSEDQEIDTCKLAFVVAVKDALNVVSGKWKLAIVCALLRREFRFGELEQLLSTVTPRVLSKDLKDLELNGIVTKRIQDGAGGKALVYALTDSGRKLENVIVEMATWGVSHRESARANGGISGAVIATYDNSDH